jgi:hypothetical protein
VFLNNEKSTQADNQRKADPRLLDNTTKMDNGNYIGKAVVCQDGSHIQFMITTSKGLCGLSPRINTQEEVITAGKYFMTTTKRYGTTVKYVNRYDADDRTIKASDFAAYEKKEGFRRSNVIISAIEIIAFTKDGVSYPTAGVEAEVHPGSLDKGTHSGSKTKEVSGVRYGGELGAMQMQFFVLSDAAAVAKFAEELRGVTADEDWD